MTETMVISAPEQHLMSSFAPVPTPVATPEIVLPPDYIPKDKRKKILLLSDDLRMPSGVGVMSKEIVIGTAHQYNWAQIGAAVNHPEVGKIMDASQTLSEEAKIPDAYLRIYPYNGYGDFGVLRTIITMEKPDALFIFTDPRYFVWLFQMEAEIREHMPIFYYDIWDDLPYPKYNRDYYRSVTALFAISKQTHNINKQVLGEENTITLSY